MPGIFVGIDWGGQHHQVCAVDAGGERRLSRRVQHDRAGLCELDRMLESLGGGLPIAIERAEGLLVEHLVATGHAVYPDQPAHRSPAA